LEHGIIKHLSQLSTVFHQASPFSTVFFKDTSSILTTIMARYSNALVLSLFALGAQAGPLNQTLLAKNVLFPQDADYAKATCEASDITHSVEQIWSDTSASSAWSFVQGRWSQGASRPDGANLNFTSYFSHQFHGPQLWECGTFGSLSNCIQTLGHCGDQHGTSGDVDVPAAYVIMNSFVQIHNVRIRE
jgi:hypothetical protein